MLRHARRRELGRGLRIWFGQEPRLRRRNKRVAWVTARLLLADNGYAIEFDALDAIRVMEDVARGALSEADLSERFRQRFKPGRT